LTPRPARVYNGDSGCADGNETVRTIGVVVPAAGGGLSRADDCPATAGGAAVIAARHTDPGGSG